jgi:3-methyladenine DNA glycosylase AlkD
VNRKWASNTAERLVEAIDRENQDEFWNIMNPVLDAKVPFPLLDEMGRLLGEAGIHDPSKYFGVFDTIIDTDKMGGYVIVGQALSAFLGTELEASINKATEIVSKGQKWYVCDIVGERVLGQALVDYFESTVPLLKQKSYLKDQEVRRSIGVAVHFFAKRRPKDVERMEQLLQLLDFMVEDRRVFVVKGVGWGLKTIGKHQPKLVEAFLEKTLATKRISKLMLRKATKYLDGKTKEELVERWQRKTWSK